MAVKVVKDTYGSMWRLPASKPYTAISTKVLHEGSPSLDVWWDRDITSKANETLMVRQENKGNIDVLSLTLAQTYDLIHALCEAVKTP